MLRTAVIAAAAVIAVVAVFLAALVGYYSRDSRETTSGVRVVVATKDIAASTEISEEMIKVIEVPEEQLVAGAFGDALPVIGQVSRVSVRKGEQITASKLARGGDIEAPFTGGGGGAGMRALSLSIEPVTTDGALVFAGDRVDILLELGGATTVVENIKVLAVASPGRALPVPADGAVQDTRSQASVTVAVEPQQAQLLSEKLSERANARLRRSA